MTLNPKCTADRLFVAEIRGEYLAYNNCPRIMKIAQVSRKIVPGWNSGKLAKLATHSQNILSSLAEKWTPYATVKFM